MRRFGRLAAVLALAVLGAINVRVRAQSAADFAQTAAYAAAQQKVLVKASSEALSTLKKNDWNHYYPGKKDHHKRVTTENTEGRGKGKSIRILFSVYFGGFRG